MSGAFLILGGVQMKTTWEVEKPKPSRKRKRWKAVFLRRFDRGYDYNPRTAEMLLRLAIAVVLGLVYGFLVGYLYGPYLIGG